MNIITVAAIALSLLVFFLGFYVGKRFSKQPQKQKPDTDFEVDWYKSTHLAAPKGLSPDAFIDIKHRTQGITHSIRVSDVKWTPQLVAWRYHKPFKV